MARNLCIHLAGADGSGKTTQARALADRLRERGLRVQPVWLRFPRLFCTPLLAYARLRGFSYQETVGGERHGYWDFSRSWLMSRVFPWVLLLDTLLMSMAKVYLPLLRGYTLICDRWVADVLVDLMLGLADARFDESLPGRLYLALLPPGARLAVIDLDSALAVARTPSLQGDRTRSARRELYLGLARRHGWPVISAEPPAEEVTARLITALEAKEAGSDVRSGDMRSGDMQSKEAKGSGYAKLDTPWLRPLLSRPWGALAVHWLFQGTLQMDPTERYFKLGVDAGLTLLFARLLGRWLGGVGAWLVGGLVAHTLNFLFNGQIYGVLKHFGGVERSWDEFNREVEALSERIDQEPSLVYAAAYGSLARSEWSPTSDLDVRIVRAPGLANGLRASWFAVRERSRALAQRFPLDLLVLDSYKALGSMAERDTPVVLSQADGSAER
jgi:hypothetical protein